MKVEQLMTPSPATCGSSENLAQVVERMWDANCGIIPVVDDSGHVINVVTDRDICVAAATRGVAPGNLLVSDMQQRRVITCRPEDDVQTVLALMKQHRVRRLPVTTTGGVLHGIVSLDDIVLCAGTRSIGATEVLSTLKAIYAPPLPVARLTA
jgi:CBS domain-containing protein